ncbi:MAG: MAE_28990/MAE_18760 family HEPN-like nuclease, partial [Cyanobacteria bacterium P01_A01_bin.68]
VISRITDISIHIVNTGFNKEKLFSGNIDGRVIKTIAQDYGFSYKTDARKTGDGSDLLTVKSNRNDLAHGIKSFAEVGREKSADELVKIKNKVVKYLKQILLNIEIYLSHKEYLNPI